jgi:hypothetical protein
MTYKHSEYYENVVLAEALLNEVYFLDEDDPTIPSKTAQAQAHATLALAYATADPERFRYAKRREDQRMAAWIAKQTEGEQS